MSKTSVNARLAMIQAFANFMDSGSQSATVIFYDGVQPASPSVAADSNNASVALTTVGGTDQTGQLSGTVSPTMSPVMIGAIPVTMSQGTLNNFIEVIDYQTKAASITEEIEGFSTVIAKPIQLYEFSSKQYIGEIAAGLYKISYPSGTGPSYLKTVLPQQIPEYKNGSLCYIHASWPTSNSTGAPFLN